MHKLT